MSEDRCCVFFFFLVQQNLSSCDLQSLSVSCNDSFIRFVLLSDCQTLESAPVDGNSL